MIVLWRGEGYVAFLALAVPMVTLFVTSYVLQMASPVVPVGSAFVGAGVTCAVAYRLLKDPLWDNTLYFLPLPFWAFVYSGFGLFLLSALLLR
jgi:hypothetical protein